MGVSRQCASKWVNRHREYGALGSGIGPASRTTTTPAQVTARIEVMRRERKWSARRIALELAGEGVMVSVGTVSRYLVQLGLNRHRREQRQPRQIHAPWPAHLVHLDGKKVGVIPRRRWLARPRPRQRTGQAVGPGQGVLRPTWHPACHRIVTDNEACYRAHHFATVYAAPATNTSSPTHPATTARSSATTASWPKELLYTHTWTSVVATIFRIRPTTIDPTLPPEISHRSPDSTPATPTSRPPTTRVEIAGPRVAGGEPSTFRTGGLIRFHRKWRVISVGTA
jgi:transposase